MDINNIIFVEDGSIAIDELKAKINDKTEIVSYRQGSPIPSIVPCKIERYYPTSYRLTKTLTKTDDIVRVMRDLDNLNAKIEDTLIIDDTYYITSYRFGDLLIYIHTRDGSTFKICEYEAHSEEV